MLKRQIAIQKDNVESIPRSRDAPPRQDCVDLVDGPATFSLTMMTVRRILAPVVLLLALAGLTVSGVEAATMMPGQPAALAGDGMIGDGMIGGGMIGGGMTGGEMPECDGCGGDARSLAGCAMVCGPSCAGDLGQVAGSRSGKRVAVGGVIAPGFVLPPGVALSRDPPKPKASLALS